MMTFIVIASQKLKTCCISTSEVKHISPPTLFFTYPICHHNYSRIKIPLAASIRVPGPSHWVFCLSRAVITYIFRSHLDPYFYSSILIAGSEPVRPGVKGCPLITLCITVTHHWCCLCPKVSAQWWIISLQGAELPETKTDFCESGKGCFLWDLSLKHQSGQMKNDLCVLWVGRWTTAWITFITMFKIYAGIYLLTVRT